MQDSNACIFCDHDAETLDHILLGCTFSREVWHSCLRKLHLQDTVVPRHEQVMAWWLQSRKRIPKPIHRGFNSLFFLIGWMIWKERNARTFNGIASSAAQLEGLIQQEFDAWCMAGYNHLSSLVGWWRPCEFAMAAVA
jgi:hypothetical protein